jgi:hypothetical protein
MGGSTSWLEENLFSLVTSISQNAWRIYLLHPSEFIAFEKKIVLIINVALIAHHTPTLMSRNGTTCINLGSSADQYLLP